MRFEKFVWTAVAGIVALCIGTAPIDAIAANGPKPKPTVKTAPAPKVKTTTSPKVKVKTTVAQKPSKPPKPAKPASAKTTKTTAKASKPAKTTKASKATSGKPSKTTTTTTTTTETTTTSTSTTSGETTPLAEPLSKAQQHLMKHPKMQEKMMARMGLTDPADVMAAASGFKNLGQFVAAVNVSNNHGIEFADLKLAMTGINAEGVRVNETTMSLGQALQSLKGMDSTTATTTANTAMTQASTEISTTTTTTTNTPTTTTSKSKNPKKNGNQG
jgi:hypothetical protein